MADLTVTQGDSKPDVLATIRDTSTGDPEDLTNATSVFFRMRKPDDRLWTVNNACTITDAPNGRVRYTWGTKDLATAGEFEAYFHVVWNDTSTQSTRPVNTIEVQRR